MTSWHLRAAHFEHQHRFENLVDLHHLTLRWANLFQVEIHSQHPGLKALKGIHHDLWMLDLFPQPSLESFLIEHSSEAILPRLEKVIWITQSWLMKHLFKVLASNENALRSALEQESWRLGKEYATRRWGAFITSRKKISLPEVALAFYNSPFSHYPHSDPFLVERSTHSQIFLTRSHCPHHSPFRGVLEVADELCSLHAHGMRGFAFALHPSLQIELPDPQRTCIQRWHLHEASESP